MNREKDKYAREQAAINEHMDILEKECKNDAMKRLELQQQNKILQEKLMKASEETNLFKESVEELQEQLQVLVNTDEQRQKECKELHKEVESLKENLKTEKQIKDELNIKLQNLQANQEEKSKHLDDILEQNHSLQDKILELSKDIEETRKNFEVNENELKSKLSLINNYESESCSLKNEIQEIKNYTNECHEATSDLLKLVPSQNCDSTSTVLPNISHSLLIAKEYIIQLLEEKSKTVSVVSALKKEKDDLNKQTLDSLRLKSLLVDQSSQTDTLYSCKSCEQSFSDQSQSPKNFQSKEIVTSIEEDYIMEEIVVSPKKVFRSNKTAKTLTSIEDAVSDSILETKYKNTKSSSTNLEPLECAKHSEINEEENRLFSFGNHLVVFELENVKTLLLALQKQSEEYACDCDLTYFKNTLLMETQKIIEFFDKEKESDIDSSYSIKDNIIKTMQSQICIQAAISKLLSSRLKKLEYSEKVSFFFTVIELVYSCMMKALYVTI